ncbi:DNA-binding protein [uncultured Chryseobacterium sp.]|uniref:DNA-binding protein n=1 Tax=uncultured Chryseobacterium sp. TaxID=259322 RepID=UPI00261FD356|nr:DNA-binding protein [uncultured Chryseobacterium sp.]
MKKDLTNSIIERKNVLNNNVAMPEIYKALSFPGILLEKKYRYTKQQLSDFFEVDVRTIERILENNEDEILSNGYEVLTGNRLKLFKEEFNKVNNSIYKEELNKAPSLGVFTFKALLNLGMLLTDSERARQVRSLILDIIIDVLNKKAQGHTKYINQREEQYLFVAMDEFDYRKKFTNAINCYIEKNNFKYSQLTDKVYKSIFKENASEYKKILKLNSKQSVRSTFYTEILRIISDYENAFAKELKESYDKKGDKLTLTEAHLLFADFSRRAENMMQASIEDARSKMASRDLVFRDALHEKLEDYIKEVSEDDFERFLGEQSMAIEQRLEENKDVFKRLKER